MRTEFDPVSFGFVMATGIISIALMRLELPILSLVFLLLALVGYVALILHACFSFKSLLREISDPQTLFNRNRSS